MNELNRNTRTLIVSFAVAIMALIPLRFLEVANGFSNYQGAAVLGETVRNEVVLPNAQLSQPKEAALLEAPYAELESKATLEVEKKVPAVKAATDSRVVEESKCMANATVEADMVKLTNDFLDGNLSSNEVNKLLVQMEELEALRCR